MRPLFGVLALCASLCLGCAYIEDKIAQRHPSKYNYNPADGVVPDESTATRIAEIVLKRAYGEEVVDRELPLRVTLRSDNVWVVQGTLHNGSDVRGGVAAVEIAKKDCQVLRLSHGM